MRSCWRRSTFVTFDEDDLVKRSVSSSAGIRLPGTVDQRWALINSDRSVALIVKRRAKAWGSTRRAMPVTDDPYPRGGLYPYAFLHEIEDAIEYDVSSGVADGWAQGLPEQHEADLRVGALGFELTELTGPVCCRCRPAGVP